MPGREFRRTLCKGLRKFQIAELLGKSPSTIAKEIKKHRELKIRNTFNDDVIKLNLKDMVRVDIFEKNNIVFIVVDGSKEVIPTPQGYYREETLDWLEEQCSDITNVLYLAEKTKKINN